MKELRNLQNIKDCTKKYKSKGENINPLSKVDSEILLEILKNLQVTRVNEELLDILENYKVEEDNSILNELIKLNLEAKRIVFLRKRYFITIGEIDVDVSLIRVVKKTSVYVRKWIYQIIVNPNTDSTGVSSNIKVSFSTEEQRDTYFLQLRENLKEFNINFIEEKENKK